MLQGIRKAIVNFIKAKREITFFCEKINIFMNILFFYLHC